MRTLASPGPAVAAHTRTAQVSAREKTLVAQMADASGTSGRVAAPPEPLVNGVVSTSYTDAQCAVPVAQRRKRAVLDQGMLKRPRLAATPSASSRSSKEVLDSSDLLQLILSKCGVQGIFAASAVCHSWQGGAQAVLLRWQDESRWSCSDDQADAVALCEEALAVLQDDSGIFADHSNTEGCCDAAGRPGAVRCSDRVLVTCVELLAAARNSAAAAAVRSKIDRCFLKWLTLLGTPALVDAAVHRAVAPLVHLHIRSHLLPPSARGARSSSCPMLRKTDFQESLGPLLRQLVDPRVCLRDLSTMAAMLRVMRMCFPFFSRALGSRICEHLQRIALDKSLLSSVGCPPEAQPLLPHLILEVLGLAQLEPHMLHALPVLVARIVAHSGDQSLWPTLAATLASHGARGLASPDGHGDNVAPLA